MLGIVFGDVGATYTSKGMIFLIVRFGNGSVDALVLDDHPSFGKHLPPGTVMKIERWTSVWEESMRIASPGEWCSVHP